MKRARDGALRLGKAFVEHDLLTYASAISFQLFSAIVPFLLFTIGLLGLLNLESVWTDLAARIRPNVSPAAFKVIDESARRALESHQSFWVTAGLLLALWQISGSVRAVMGALNTVYRVKTERSWARRMLLSLALSVAVALCFLMALGAVGLGRVLFGDHGAFVDAGLFVVRYAIAGGFLLAAVALLVRCAPEKHQPVSSVSFGSLLILGAWLVMSGGFVFYLTDVANYGTVFGNLATVVVLMGYIYASALVFLGGVQVDALRLEADERRRARRRREREKAAA